MFDEETAPRKKSTHEIGQDLAPLSLAEIDARIELLKAEIERLTQVRGEKLKTQAAADALFRL
ncbi:MAG TPA: DUF1192 domain-containing protein [Rhabdaerophilum sp.]|nr:DUF1192 domain-containing protein [Rhabdaerophilum sp.]